MKVTDRNDKSSRVLNVYLNKVDVGALTLLPDDRTLFAFSQSYVDNPMRPTLSLWFKTPLGELKTEEKIRSGAALPPFFSNLLPEGHLRDYLAKKSNVKSGREFFLIAALGKDLPGAVRVESREHISDHGPEQPKSLLEGQSVLRFSLAGIQLKFSAIMESSGGLTIPADGVGGSWITKLPSYSHKHVPEAEYSMLKLAKKVGINVPQFKLIPTESIKGLPPDVNASFGQSLAVKRFDRRDDDIRIHMEDFAQIFGIYSDEKYKHASFDRIGYVLLSECGEADFLEFIRRLAFSVMIGNGDMHLKNWSLLYSDTRNPRLSPAYDFVPTKVYLATDTLGLQLGGTKDFSEVTEKNFAKLASKAAASERIVSAVVQETVQRTYDAWRELRSELPLTEEIKKALESHMNSLRLRPTSINSAPLLLTLNPREVMRVEEDLMPATKRNSQHRILGQTYMYGSDALLSAAKRNSETLDQFLTRRIASGLHASPLKGKAMILYALARDSTFLTVSGPHNALCSWLSKLPGLQESGREWAPDNATPFVYWNGKDIYRVYQPPIDDDLTGDYYVTDLGKWNPPYVFRTDAANYRSIAERVNREPNYSAIPQTSQQLVELNGHQVPVHHAFIRFAKQQED
jgi:serine/threonine-protein kinase HipA